MSNNKKLIIVSGVTAIGKSNIAYKLAKKLNSEIILLDIFQSYKQLNICSNKPAKEYLNNIKYHNYDKFDLVSLVNLTNEDKIKYSNQMPNAINISSNSRNIALDLINPFDVGEKDY